MGESGPATANSWRRLPFGEGVPVRYRAVLGVEEFERVSQGFIPRQMEDKWFIYYEAPYLFFHRSWTGQAVYRVEFEGMEVVQALWSEQLAKGRTPQEVEYQGRLLQFLVSNLLLGQKMKFPLPEGADRTKAALLQHTISGTGFPSE
jgi:hypothetical protein